MHTLPGPAMADKTPVKGITIAGGDQQEELKAVWKDNTPSFGVAWYKSLLRYLHLQPREDF